MSTMFYGNFPLCVNCKSRVTVRSHECKVKRIDVVTGEEEKVQNHLCTNARSESGFCGPTGKFFKHKTGN